MSTFSTFDNLICAFSDADFLAACQRTDGEHDNPHVDALLATERRQFDV